MNHHLYKPRVSVRIICKTVSVLIITLLTATGPAIHSLSHAQSPAKTEIEAVFIYKFLNYIEWPEKDLSDKFTICTIGNSEMNKFIDIIEQKEHKGMKIDVIKKAPENDLKKCRIIFFGDAEKKLHEKALNLSAENAILTISSKKDFIESGGMINFIFTDNRVSFEINYKKADLSGLKISSKLLRLAKKVINK